jgi:UDP-N-acetylmuramoyl-tripeptide--D-alanyl-D-alanine ligase
MIFPFSTVAVLLVFLAYLAFATKRIMTYLHIYQQEEYDTGRFLRWMSRTRAFDVKFSAILLLIILFTLAFPVKSEWFIFLYFVAFAAMAGYEPDPRKDSKKKLVLTQRAQRIFFLTLFLAGLMASWCFLVHMSFLWILNVQLIPFLMLVANTALGPYENSVQKKFWTQAHNKLLSLKPTVIGITGSFGKTSVKHILGHVLKSYAPTLITPGSVNTPMGVTRIIREQLEDNHKFLVVEMGAYGQGSIKRLCQLAPPDLGIITAVGHAHYERFKTIETVAAAKFELAEAVVDKGGTVIVHEKPLEIEYAGTFTREKRQNFVVTGKSPTSDVVIERAEQLPEGLRVFIRWNGDSFRIDAPLYGLHHADNLALAFAAAVTLGIPAENVITALKSVPQITHRLEVKPQPDGTIWIDDAFNSNPVGFSSALDLLPVLGRQGRKILVTPGMVELGEAHNDAHTEIGKKAGQICDIALIVQAQRIPTFVEGFRATGSDKKLIEVNSFTEASAWLDKNRQSGDVVLIENDLPDLYEKKLKI